MIWDTKQTRIEEFPGPRHQHEVLITYWDSITFENSNNEKKREKSTSYHLQLPILIICVRSSNWLSPPPPLSVFSNASTATLWPRLSRHQKIGVCELLQLAVVQFQHQSGDLLGWISSTHPAVYAELRRNTPTMATQTPLPHTHQTAHRTARI